MVKKEKKKKRRPSGYNLHIKKCMIANKDQMAGKPFGSAGPVMKQCSQAWNNLSEKEKDQLREESLKCVQNPAGKWDCPE